MKYSTHIKPISYVKANAADVIKNVCESRQPYIITVNGEAKAVLQDVRDYEETQERIALLEIIAQGRLEQLQGKVRTASDVFQELEQALNAGA
jgi:prevent-host-death family protein